MINGQAYCLRPAYREWVRGGFAANAEARTAVGGWGTAAPEVRSGFLSLLSLWRRELLQLLGHLLELCVDGARLHV